jgi:phage RecT family recombinase
MSTTTPPLSASERTKQLHATLEANREAIFSGAAPGVDPDYYIGLFMQAVRRNLQLLDCTNRSLFDGLGNSAMLGLPINSVDGDGYLIPRNRNVKRFVDGREVWDKVLEAHFQPGYQGKLKLAYECPLVASVNCDVVRDGDEYEVWLGSRQEVHHVPGTKRGIITHAYCVIATTRGKNICKSWTTEECMEHAQQHSGAWFNGKLSESSTWFKNRPAMMMKTMFIQASKFAPSTDRARRMNQIEDMIEHGVDVAPVLVGLKSGDTQSSDALEAALGIDDNPATADAPPKGWKSNDDAPPSDFPRDEIPF